MGGTYASGAATGIFRVGGFRPQAFSDGYCPFRWQNMEVIKALVAKKCDPQASDVHGHTPADEAEYWGHTEVSQEKACVNLRARWLTHRL